MDVLVIGGANIDIKAKCASTHVSGTSNIAHISTKFGGVGRNIAHNLARLGVNVSLLCAVGKDENGLNLLKATAAAGVDVSASLVTRGTTGSYLALLDHHGELITAANDMTIIKTITAELIASQAEKIQSAKYVLADCNLESETLAAIVKLAGPKLIIEPVSVEKSKRMLGHAIFLATPNLDQIFATTGTREPKSAAAILRAGGVQNLVIHAGKTGAYVADAISFTHCDARAEKIVDVTGAGDAATVTLRA